MSSETPIRNGQWANNLTVFSYLLTLLSSKLKPTLKGYTKSIREMCFYLKSAATKSIKIIAHVDEVHFASGKK